MATAPAEWKRNTRYSIRELERWAEEGHRKPLEDIFRWDPSLQLTSGGIIFRNLTLCLVAYRYVTHRIRGKERRDEVEALSVDVYGGGDPSPTYRIWMEGMSACRKDGIRKCTVPDMTMAYWDKGSKESRKSGLPASLTNKLVELDGEIIKNPLMCFTFPVDIESSAQFKKSSELSGVDFSKRAGTHTVRYPMSAFYASKVEKVAAAGEAHNDVMRGRYPTCEDRLQALNLNVKLALVGDSQNNIDADCDGTADGETYARLRRCLDAPNFNIFSNNNSTGKWFTSLEQPHDEIHLAIGGQDHQPVKAAVTAETYDENGEVLTSSTKASPQVMGSNGDMGENETAAFDPVFFFHHCNIDRMLWIWQKKWGKTDKDSVQIDPTDMDGTYGQSPKGQGGTRAISGITKLTMDTPLHPFRKPTGDFVTSRDMVDTVNQLNIDYSFGSFDKEEWPSEVAETTGPEAILSIVNINKARFLGSFRVVVSHQDPASGTLSSVASVSVLSRWNLKRCKNCLIHISRDVHVDLSSVKRRFPHDDISKHAFEVEFFDRSSSDDKPIAASGRYTNGEWKLLTGHTKIETVRIELDERQ